MNELCCKAVTKKGKQCSRKAFENNFCKQHNNINKVNTALNNKYNFIEVCSGCGGLSSGFMNKNFTPILLNEIDKTCVSTLKSNHPNVKIHDKSMTELDLDEYKNKDIDLLMGGVPCQSFSQAGKRKGLKDKRGNLILTFINMLSILKPKTFLIENVKGLLNHNKGETFDEIYKKIKKLKLYEIYHKVLNANDYSVPQNRERLIIVGVKKTINKKYEFPKIHSKKLVLKDVLTNCPESDGLQYNKAKYDIMKLVPMGGCWVNLPVNIQKAYMKKSFYSGGGKRGIAKRLDMNKPSLTLLTTPSQKQTERCHPIKTRPLQILEYARIQTFPDNYKFSGSINQKYKQIGNAVPVKLAEALALSIIDVLS